jgi:hypothetical protein
MPFIRQDFARMRSDEYPIRLWTVAIFIFAVLPLLKKREIGRLLIGNEFDTTRKLSHKGITHYDGLYDQGRYFDNALSRYYLRKGWNISQFSILRSLSELLIMKILVNRYPDLQRHQISCHAAHKEGDRMVPCGNCEKCRRIMCMMIALDADPTNCGYKPEAIESALKSLSPQSLHQESASVRHLIWILSRKKKRLPIKGAFKNIKPKPEVLKLRFDPEHSPMEMFPTDLRLKLFRLCLEYADGAVHRQNREWVSFNPLSVSDLHKLYPFEMSPEVPLKSDSSFTEGNTERILWGELTWPEAEEQLKRLILHCCRWVRSSSTARICRWTRMHSMRVTLRSGWLKRAANQGRWYCLWFLTACPIPTTIFPEPSASITIPCRN